MGSLAHTTILPRWSWPVPSLLSAIPDIYNRNSLVLTPFFLNSGSIIPCILFHALINGYSELGFRYGNDMFTVSMIDSLIKLGRGVGIFIFQKKILYCKNCQPVVQAC